jgi:ketosteroid isomerase-like protein
MRSLVASLAVLVSASVSSGDVRSEIEAANRQFEAAVAKGDGKQIVGLYTADGQALPAGAEAVSGPAALGKFWQGVFDSGVKGARLRTLEVESMGDNAYEVGQYELLDAAGKTLDRGKYVVVWKKEGGRFKLHRDIWTTSIGIAAAAPPK